MSQAHLSSRFETLKPKTRTLRSISANRDIPSYEIGTKTRTVWHMKPDGLRASIMESHPEQSTIEYGGMQHPVESLLESSNRPSTPELSKKVQRIARKWKNAP